jgi:phosphoheptose isomerase
VARAAAEIGAAVDAGRTVLAFGNGGSAADAQHFAAELVGRFIRERAGMAAVALTADMSVLTSIANDYGFERAFALVRGAVPALDRDRVLSNDFATIAAQISRGAYEHIVWDLRDPSTLAHARPL